MVNLGYLTRGLGLLLLGCFFALLVPFSGIDDDGDVAFAVGREWPIWWRIPSIFLRGTR